MDLCRTMPHINRLVIDINVLRPCSRLCFPPRQSTLSATVNPTAVRSVRRVADYFRVGLFSKDSARAGVAAGSDRAGRVGRVTESSLPLGHPIQPGASPSACKAQWPAGCGGSEGLADGPTDGCATIG